MTLNGAIMQLVEMRENSLMPAFFKPYFDKVIETVSECEEPSAQPETAKRTAESTQNVSNEDLISRKMAIDALAEIGSLDTEADIEYAIEVFELLPSAQPEITTCRDCKHYEADIMGNPWGVCCHKDWVIDSCGSLVDEKGWCYRAKRRTDEAD